MKKLKNIIIIIQIFIIIILLYLIIMKIHKKNEIGELNNNESIVNNDDISQNVDNKIEVLKDNDILLVLNSCINKYYTYSSCKNVENIMKILNKDYIKEEEITENNIFNILEDNSAYVSFFIDKILYKKTNDILIEYYVLGKKKINNNSNQYLDFEYVSEEELERNYTEKDFELTIILNYGDNTFSVKPYVKESV